MAEEQECFVLPVYLLPVQFFPSTCNQQGKSYILILAYALNKYIKRYQRKIQTL
jgi:hypothetical protein